MATAVHTTNPDRDLSSYLRDINKFPMLSAEEELELARRWRDDQDVKAADRLVTSHLRLVARIAAGYRGYGLPFAELVSEGNVGMMQAVKRFDPDRGFRLATYAMWWIRAAVQAYVLHSSSLVKMGTTAAQKRLFFNLRRLKVQMNVIDDGDLQPDQVSRIARLLGVPTQDVISMNGRMAAPDHSLNTPINADGDAEWQDWLADQTEGQDTAIANREELSDRKALLVEALKGLDGRQRHILTERWLKEEPTPLEALSQRYGVSRERVRQIEVRAIEKLRKAMKPRMTNSKYPPLSGKAVAWAGAPV